jgi:hypothetical protein
VMDIISSGVSWLSTVMLSVAISVFTFNTLLTSFRFF